MPDADPRRRFCSTACKGEFHRAARPGPDSRPEPRDGGPSNTKQDPQYIRDAKALVEKRFSNLVALDDEVGELIRQEIRDAIRPVIRAKVLGAVDLMTEMLPVAMGRLYQDLDSPMWSERSRAYGLVLKYAMPFADDNADKDLGRIIVEHSVAGTRRYDGDEEMVVPEGEFVERVEASLLLTPGEPEAFEADWPTCFRCDMIKHPESGKLQADGRFQCSSCEYRHNYEMRASPDDRDA